VQRWPPESGTHTSVEITEAPARIATANLQRVCSRTLRGHAGGSRRQKRGACPSAPRGRPYVIRSARPGYPSTLLGPHLAAAGGVDLMPLENAPVVQTLIDAGAIILGKTNIPAFSNDNTRANSSWAGPTLNAVNIHLAPGASSSGTATAVGGGFAVWGMAEETGGSIQTPAAAQSLVGIKVRCFCVCQWPSECEQPARSCGVGACAQRCWSPPALSWHICFTSEHTVRSVHMLVPRCRSQRRQANTANHLCTTSRHGCQLGDGKLAEFTRD
jgi:hypothetical protein